MIFEDFEKTSDSVPKNLLCDVLEKINVDISLINTIKEIYDQNKCHIKMGSTLSRGFKTYKGLLQGCSVSLTLYKIYLEVVLKQLSQTCKNVGLCLIPTTSINYILFANNQVIII